MHIKIPLHFQNLIFQFAVLIEKKLFNKDTFVSSRPIPFNPRNEKYETRVLSHEFSHENFNGIIPRCIKRLPGWLYEHSCGIKYECWNNWRCLMENGHPMVNVENNPSHLTDTHLMVNIEITYHLSTSEKVEALPIKCQSNGSAPPTENHWKTKLLSQ